MITATAIILWIVKRIFPKRTEEQHAQTTATVKLFLVVASVVIVIGLFGFLVKDCGVSRNEQEAIDAQGEVIKTDAVNAVTDQKIEELAPKVEEAGKTARNAQKRTESAQQAVNAAREKNYNGVSVEEAQKLCEKAYEECK